MLKINRDGIVSDSADVREHPGTGEPMTGIEHPADGTMSPLVGNDEPFHIEGGCAGAEGLEVLRVPAEGAASEAPAPVVEEKAEAEAPPAARAAPPRTPPRRPPAVPRE